MDGVFEACARIHLDHASQRTAASVVDGDLATLSSLIASSARPSADVLKELSWHHDPGDQFKNCCLRAVTSAENPLIPGMTISIALGEAAQQATEGEQRTITGIKESVDNLLLEIFERLPRTVRGFDDVGGKDACTGMFEPGLKRRKDERQGLGGPLEMIVSNQQQMQAFCEVPLVMDYLSSKFTMGLPDINDTEGLLRNANQLDYLARGQTDGRDDGLVLADNYGLCDLPWFEPGPTGWNLIELLAFGFLLLVDSGVFLQAASASSPSLAYFPGAQFVVAGVVAAPSSYYRVPAMRMALDFVVYLGMVGALCFFVLFHSEPGSTRGDDGTVNHNLSWGEGACALTFITVSIDVFRPMIVPSLFTKRGCQVSPICVSHQGFTSPRRSRANRS